MPELARTVASRTSWQMPETCGINYLVVQWGLDGMLTKGEINHELYRSTQGPKQRSSPCVTSFQMGSPIALHGGCLPDL